ncbi:MAG: hypothetical protein AAF637_09590 [Pseudomonadota bacterium]
MAKAKNAAGEKLPEGVIEVAAPEPLEISGVASVPGGYAVVGDEDNRHGRIWPSGTQFALPARLKGPESIAVGFGPSGEQLWLVLGEQNRRLVDFDGGSYVFSHEFEEVGGRGLEGLAVRWRNGSWQVVVSLEGGFFDWKSSRSGEVEKPKVAWFTWHRGEGCGTAPEVISLDVPKPSGKQRFRAPDLVWAGDHLLVLLTSTDKKRKKRDHTWLQRFDSKGRARGEPMKLEKLWGSYHEDKNWEGLDWDVSGSSLVIAYDEKNPKKHRALVVFPYV